MQEHAEAGDAVRGAVLRTVVAGGSVREQGTPSAPHAVPGAPATPSGRARVLRARAVTVAAALVLWVVLVAPDRLADLRPAAFLRVPVELWVLGTAALLLPSRARGVLAAVAGVVLGLLAVVRVLDVGYRAVLDRPFDPVDDWGSLGPALGVLSDSVGPLLAVAGTALVAGLTLALLVAVTLAALRLSRTAARHRTRALRGLVVIGVAWSLCAATGIRTGGVPLASAGAAGLLADQWGLVWSGLRDQRWFDAELNAPDQYALAPGTRLLTGLRGKDVLLVFIESYGRVAVQGSEISPQVGAVLNAGTGSLRAAGFSARSAFLTSPTSGGASWLAHSTLQSGLWIDSERRYSRLQDSDRLTLSGAFKRAGWRTVLDIPSSPSPWPEGERLYRVDRMYGTGDVGYAGPTFGYAKIPDQYTLAALHRLELEPAPRRPVMAEVDLVSSHLPWAPLPRMVPWQELGRGDIYRSMPGQGEDWAVIGRDPEEVRAGYGASIRYSLSALLSFVTTFGDRDLVVVVLGDHQPAPVVAGEGVGRDVPVTIMSKDPAVLDRIASWGWQDGMLPGPSAPTWRMDAFRDRFLAAYR